MYSVRMILDELVYGSRPIVTNVALNLGRLNEYLQREYPEKNVDIFERVRLMDDEMTGQFWTYRPKGRDEWVRIPVLTKQEWSEGKKPLYAGVEDHGVYYVIDECHNFFNARAWAETGRDVLFYLSQHRKLGDTVVWITQAIMNVDKQFRSVTQDYTYLRNLTKERMGLFRLPAMFVRKTYGEPASSNSQPLEMGSFRLNVSGLGSLYNTAAGVGIHDRVGADIGERKKGIHWLVPVFAIPLIVFAIAKFAPVGVASWFNPMRHGAALALAQSKTNGVAAVFEKVARPGDLASAPSVTSTLRFTNQLDMVAFMTVPALYNPLIRHTTVVLSDGRRYHNGDGHLQYLCEDYCIVDGETNWYHPVVSVQSQAFAASVPVSVSPVVLPVAGGAEPVQYESESIVKYVIPNHVNTLAHPAVRSAVGGGYSQGYSGNY
jgi:hypothetical protein